MSNFQCEKCGTYLIDTPGGGYVTECERYPKIKFATAGLSQPDWSTEVPICEKPMPGKVAKQTGLIEWEKGFRTRYGHLIWKHEDSIVNHVQSLLVLQAKKTRRETIEKIIEIVKSEYLFLGAPDGYYVGLNLVMEILESLKPPNV